MSVKVTERIAANYDRVRKGVQEIMGGKILEYETKTIMREGFNQGVSQGINQTMVHIVDNLMKNLGWSQDEACCAIGVSSGEYQSAKETLMRK